MNRDEIANGTTTLGREQKVKLVRGDEIQVQAVPWLWHGYIAQGRLTILAGRPGTGKTTVALALAASVTNGGYWPDGTPAPTGQVLIWSGEDDLADTLMPRLAMAGANPANIHFICSTVRAGQEAGFDPAIDMALLRNQLTRNGAYRLLVVDPIVSAISGDSHKNAEVRRGLQPLCDFAAEIGCAVLGISHLSKGTEGRDPTERVTGSLAFGAVARTVLMVGKATGADSQPKRLLVRTKNNLGDDTGGFEFTIEEGAVPGHADVCSSKVVWGRHVDGEARELLAELEDPNALTSPISAQGFLRELLASGPRAVSEIQQEAKLAGIGWRSVERAKSKLNVVGRKVAMNGGWEWYLPTNSPTEDRHNQQKTANLDDGGLREDLAPFGEASDDSAIANPPPDNSVEWVF